MSRPMLIYLFTFADGRQYVGQTVRSFAVRLSQHRRMVTYGSRLPVHCAWRDLGEPSIQVIGEYPDMDSLHAAERALIAELGTLRPHGYNVSTGGDTAPSKSPDVAAKIAAKARGRKHSAETLAAIGNASRRNWKDPEYRQRVAAGIALSFTPERRAKLSENAKRVHTGKTISEEHKAALRSRVVSEETRRKMSDAKKGKKKPPRSEETRQKLSESAKRKWQDPEHAAKRAAAIRAAWTPEKRAAMAELKRGKPRGKSSIA